MVFLVIDSSIVSPTQLLTDAISRRSHQGSVGEATEYETKVSGDDGAYNQQKVVVSFADTSLSLPHYRAVSIWFQNRRQAMKKRASRFGGVEGVNGPTVTAATMQVLDVEGAQQGAPGSKELEMERLQKWMTLDDVVTAGDHSDKSMAHRPDQTEEEEQSDRTGDADVSFSSAPILDFICQQRGQQQLSRMASMPSLASIMSAKGGAAKPNGSLKDLRDLLPLHRGRLPLIRASSASALPVVGLEESSAAQEGAVVQSRLNHASSITKAVESKQSSAAGSQCTVVGGKVAFPTMLAQVLQSRGLEVPKQGANIWQRMQSSSSSSDGVTSSPDSNKENRDPNVPRPRREEDADEDEDEEKTLRMIAGRRAAKESAKKERKLSEMGKKYIEEADARVALQQKKRSSFSGHSAGQHALGKGPAPASAYSAQRGLVRAASDAHAFRANRNPMVLVRVPSLELTAGRDRAKDDGTSPSQSMMDLRLAKRPAHIEQDENADASLLHHRVKKAGKLSQQPARQQAHGRIPLQSVKNMPAKASGVSYSRPFAPSRSLPVSTATLSMSRLGAQPTRHVLGTSSSRFEGPRESSARFDGQDWHSASSSQEDSENGSDEWLEAWAQEKRRPTVVNAGALRERSAAVLNSEATRQERKRSAQITHPTPRHDDSGFYGSESGLEDECDDDIIVEKRSSKRRLLNQNNSSSPLKRGDERDRLAAETLLGLGSRA